MALFGETCPEFRLKAVTDVLFKRTLYDKWNNLTISMDHTPTPGLVGFVLQRVGSEDADGEGRRRSGSPTTLKDVFNLVGSGRLKYL